MRRVALEKLTKIFGIVTFAVVVYSAWVAIECVELAVSGLRTKGTVVNIQHWDHRSKDVTQRWKHYPIVQFQTKTGANVRFIGSIGSPSRGYYLRHDEKLIYEIGDRVPVLYLPNLPEVARIDLFDEIWPEPLYMLKVSSVFMLIAGMLWVACALVRARARWHLEND